MVYFRELDPESLDICARRLEFVVRTAAGGRAYLRDVLEVDFQERSRHAERARFVSGSKLTVGQPADAALGLNQYVTQSNLAALCRIAASRVGRYLKAGDLVLWTGMGRGLAAIKDEFEATGDELAMEMLRYVLYEQARRHRCSLLHLPPSLPPSHPPSPAARHRPLGRGALLPPHAGARGWQAGSCTKLWPHAGDKMMDAFAADEEGKDERAGKTLSYFVDHPYSKAAGLLDAHVAALRLYTTAVCALAADQTRDLHAMRLPSHVHVG